MISRRRPHLTINEIALSSFLGLFLHHFRLILTIRHDHRIVTVVLIIQLRLSYFKRPRRNGFTLPIVRRPRPRHILRVNKVKLHLRLPNRWLTNNVTLTLLIRRFSLRRRHQRVTHIRLRHTLRHLLYLFRFNIIRIRPNRLVINVNTFELTFRLTLPNVSYLLRQPRVRARIVQKRARRHISNYRTRNLVVIVRRQPRRRATLPAER